MRFKEFLMREDGVAARHLAPGKMTLDQMVEWVENNAMRFVNTGNKIYRGVQSKDAEGLYNGVQMNRKAANTLNYANLWFANHNDWSKYPNRSKSFICSTDEKYAEDYGQVYLVIPADSSTIGVCPLNDLWNSFPDLFAITRQGMDGLMRLVDSLTRLADAGNFENDWDHFAAYLNKVDLDMLTNAVGDYAKMTDLRDSLEGLIEFMQKKQLETLYEVFERVLSPKKNGFSMVKASHFDTPDNHEVWMSGSILMVEPSTWSKIKEQING